MTFYPRKCDNCGCGMDTGYLWDSTETFCTTDCLLEWLYHEEVCFSTEWDVENDSDGEVYDEKGNEWVIKKCSEGNSKEEA